MAPHNETELQEGVTNHVSIKPPQFLETSASSWFKIMEAQFVIGKVTLTQTQFFHCLGALPSHVVDKLSNDILESHNYSTLKEAVVSFYERSKPEIFENLISNTTMTGKPSIFLNEILKAAGKVGVGDDLIKHKFIQSLPPNIAPIVAAQQDTPLKQLGTLADSLMHLVSNQKSTYTPAYNISNRPSRSPTRTPRPSFKTSQPIPADIPTGLRPFSETQRPKVCRGHIYFGEKAKSCKPWCRWPNKGPNVRMLPNSRPSSPVNSEN
jgi:hypothetical protein